mmetsp:Transcript_35386/g.26368  ORF Transcript_35386/g.26368 Transcript_35386/m.26368 type:complete len:177 (-) Transcript_35386:317-847(-)
MCGIGGLACLVAILGVLTAIWKNSICAACFGFWSFSISLIFLIIGGLLIFIGVYADTFINDLCSGNPPSYLESFSDTIDDLDHSMGDLTAEYMCTYSYCPCPSDLDITLWQADEQANNDWGRTAYVASSVTYDYIYSAQTSSETKYKSFKECYDYLQTYTSSSSSDYISDDILDMI